MVPSPTVAQARGMTTSLAAGRRSLSLLDLGSLIYLGAVWGAAFLFLRIASPEIGPAWAAEVRLAIGAAVLVLVAGRATWRVARTRLVSFLLVGALFSALPFTLIAVATITLPAGFAALLNAATPLFTAAIAVGFMGQRISLRVGGGLAVGVVAVVLLVGWSPLEPGATTVLAIAAGLGAPASYAVAGNLVRARLSDVPPVELATGMLAAGAVIALPVALVSGAPGALAVDGAFSLVGVGVLSTALAWPIFFRVLRRTTPTAASTVTFIVPAFALAWGSIVLAEPVGLGLVVGFGLILVSLMLVLGVVPKLRLPVARRQALIGRGAGGS